MKRNEIFKEVDEIIDRYKTDITQSVSILQDLQSRYKYLSKEVLIYLAKRLNVPLSRVYSLATFYKAFSLKPRGEHHICVCMGTACYVRGSSRILETIERRLGIKAGSTSQDSKFSLETVNCLGACALGPLLVIDGEYFGKMSPRKVEPIFKDIKNE